MKFFVRGFWEINFVYETWICYLLNVIFFPAKIKYGLHQNSVRILKRIREIGRKSAKKYRVKKKIELNKIFSEENDLLKQIESNKLIEKIYW